MSDSKTQPGNTVARSVLAVFDSKPMKKFYDFYERHSLFSKVDTTRKLNIDKGIKKWQKRRRKKLLRKKV
jgi:hypothetical protein